MPEPRVVDVHVHLFEDPDDPVRNGYEIWEYGEHDGVPFGTRRGTPGDLDRALAEGPIAHCVLVGMFQPGYDVRTSGSERLRAYNEWVLSTAAASPNLTPFVAADPNALGGRPGAVHLRESAARGARGIKLHPLLQGFSPDDPRLSEVYATCEELGLSVLAHSGESRVGVAGRAEPAAFAPVLHAHPRLHLILAHLGGARWHEVPAFAAAFPSVSFDLCEIIAWSGAPGAPSAHELGRLIKEVGPERILFGTDFPWYELDRTIDQLMALPLLSDEERLGILGENAVRRIGLDL